MHSRRLLIVELGCSQALGVVKHFEAVKHLSVVRCMVLPGVLGARWFLSENVLFGWKKDKILSFHVKFELIDTIYQDIIQETGFAMELG